MPRTHGLRALKDGCHTISSRSNRAAYVGFALEDSVTYRLAYEKAKQIGLGVEFMIEEVARFD